MVRAATAIKNKKCGYKEIQVVTKSPTSLQVIKPIKPGFYTINLQIFTTMRNESIYFKSDALTTKLCVAVRD